MGAPFANGTEFDVWSARWCDQCTAEPTCRVLDTALLGDTPDEWVPQASPGDYVCAQFHRKEPTPEDKAFIRALLDGKIPTPTTEEGTP